VGSYPHSHELTRQRRPRKIPNIERLGTIL